MKPRGLWVILAGLSPFHQIWWTVLDTHDLYGRKVGSNWFPWTIACLYTHKNALIHDKQKFLNIVIFFKNKYQGRNPIYAQNSIYT